MKRSAAVVAFILLTTTACGPHPKPKSGPTTTSRSGAATTTTSRPRPPKHRRVGSLDTVQPQGGSVDGEFAVSDAALREQSTIKTDPRGVIDFHLDQKLRACRAREGSEAQVAPGSGILIDFKMGTFLCGTTATGPRTTYTGGAGHVFVSNDPVFIVRVEAGGALRIEVASGFIGIPNGPNGVTVVGPGEAADVNADLAPTLSRFIQGNLGADDQAFVNQLIQTLGATAPQYPVAQTASSPTLSRATTRGSLNVAVTETDGAGPVSNFAQRLLDQFVGAWNGSPSVKVSVTIIPADRAQSLLAAGDVDLVITDTPPAGNWIPFVEDDIGHVWYSTYDASDTEFPRVLTESKRDPRRRPLPASRSAPIGHARSLR